MTELPSPDELAEAEDNIRTAIRDGEVPAVDASLPIVMAEFDRLRLVEQAATALVEHWGNAMTAMPDFTARNMKLLNALAAAVHGESP